MSTIVDAINGYLWSTPLICLCLGVGVFFSLKTRFLQVRHIRGMLRLILEGRSSKQGISSFQALAVSISGRVGTGNIAGVATAIALGGPGAVFWMWAIAFLGASTAYIESALGQIYKIEKLGEYRGGPAYYIEKGLGIKWYAALFAVVTIFAVGFFLPGVQANSIAVAFEGSIGFPVHATGAILVLLLGLVIFGGIKRIGNVAQLVIPFMAIGYILVALVIIIMNYEKIPNVLYTIIASAFGAKQAFGGIVGMAISWGVKRGIYSNEAGQGTGPQAAAAAEVSHPAKQGLVQAFSVYVDTLFICTATAFMILVTNKYNVHDGAAYIVENIPGAEIGPAYTQLAVESAFTGFGAIFVSVSLFFFAFTTLMAYYYIAETNVAYFEKSLKQKWMVTLLRIMLLFSVFYGSIKTAALAWGLGDIGVGMMAWLNIVAIVLLRKPALLSLKDYEEQRAMGLDPTFNPDKLGIKNADIWKRIAKKSHGIEQKFESETEIIQKKTPESAPDIVLP